MNHDMTHCNKADCPKRHVCKRYIAYLDVSKENMHNISMVAPDKSPCELFWDYKSK